MADESNCKQSSTWLMDKLIALHLDKLTIKKTGKQSWAHAAQVSAAETLTAGL